MLPEPTAASFSSVLRLHHEQADEGAVGVIGDCRDAAHRCVVLPSQPDPLAIGVGIDLDVADPWCEILLTGHLGDDVEVEWGKRFDLQHRQSGEGSAT